MVQQQVVLARKKILADSSPQRWLQHVEILQLAHLHQICVMCVVDIYYFVRSVAQILTHKLFTYLRQLSCGRSCIGPSSFNLWTDGSFIPLNR